MSSFELKPMDRLHMGTVVDQIIFTVPRNQVPVLLQGRVSLSTWMATFDAVHEQYERIFSQIPSGGKMCLLLIPCLIPCTLMQMFKMADAQREIEQQWLEIALKQQHIYHSAGIQVTIATELKCHGVGSDSRFRKEMVGLRFDIAPNAPPATLVPCFEVKTASRHVPISPPRRQQQSENLVKELQFLSELHQTGGLTDHEFAQAKAQLLNNQ
jgi:hypothetical protein